MTNDVDIGFEIEIRELKLTSLIPNKILPKKIKKTPKVLQIFQTIQELGIVEPIVVHPVSADNNNYLILDGHVKHRILMEQGKTIATCIIAKDDEAYTYNKRINRLSSIQEHFMVLEAVKQGVSEDKIAKLLNMNIHTIRNKKNLLSGICPDVVNLIRNIAVPAETIRALKKVKPIRQLEIISILNNMGTFKADLAKAMVRRSLPSQFVKNQSNTKKTKPDLHAGQDINHLIQETDRIKEQSGSNLVKLVTISAYLNRLLDNKKVRSYITKHYPDELKKLEKIVSIVHPGNSYESY